MDKRLRPRLGGLIVALSVGFVSLAVGGCRRAAGTASTAPRPHWVWRQPLDRGTVLRDDAVRADLESGRDDRVSHALAMLASTRGGPALTPEGEPALAEMLPILRRYASDPGGPWAHDALQALSALLPLPHPGHPAESERARAVEWLTATAADEAQDAQVRAIAIEALASQPEGVRTLERVREDGYESLLLRMLAVRSLDPTIDSRAALEVVAGRQAAQPDAGADDRAMLGRALSRITDASTPDWAGAVAALAMTPGAEVPASEADWLATMVATELPRAAGRDALAGPAHYFWSDGNGARATAVTVREGRFQVCVDNAPSACVRHDGIEPRVRAGRCDDPRCEDLGRADDARVALRTLHTDPESHDVHCGRAEPESMAVRQ